MKLTAEELRTLQLALLNMESGLTESGVAKVKSLSDKLESEVQRLTQRALDVCRYRWGEGMETGEHSYSNGVCGKCGKRQ